MGKGGYNEPDWATPGSTNADTTQNAGISANAGTTSGTNGSGAG